MDKEVKEKELIKLIESVYPQGDDYYASLSKNRNWTFGYTNDYPLQHGNGENCVVPEKMVDYILSLRTTLEQVREKIKTTYGYMEGSTHIEVDEEFFTELTTLIDKALNN